VDIFEEIPRMKKSALCIFAILMVTFFMGPKISAQADTNSVKPHITACADSMAKAFSKGDYNTMSRFSNEALVKMLGGKEEYVRTIKKTMSEGEMTEAKWEAKTGKILKVVKTAKGFQCLIEQKTTVTLKGKRIKTLSAMYGYADKAGKLWRFADLGDQGAEMVKLIAPDLDKRLIIPKTKETVENL
jgi:hypothetical protein